MAAPGGAGLRGGAPRGVWPGPGAPQPRIPRASHGLTGPTPGASGPGGRPPGPGERSRGLPCLRGTPGPGHHHRGGSSARPAEESLLVSLAEQLGWPLLADPLSGARVEGTIAAADAIVRTGPPLPETVVMLGVPWLSRALGTYVSDAARAGARVIVVDPWRRWADPTRVATEFHQWEPDAWLTAALATASPCDPTWLESWRSLERRAQDAVTGVLGSELSEPLVARAVDRYQRRRARPSWSRRPCPIRDLEWYAGAYPRPPRVLANRGVNGIDGVVSTALGVAASEPGPGVRTVALLGDLTLLHDVSGLVNVPEVPCTFVVLDNGGGGIFSFLPQAAALDAAGVRTALRHAAHQ